MSNIYKNVIELIGKTPLVEVENVEKRFKLQARLLVKLSMLMAEWQCKERDNGKKKSCSNRAWSN